jgi:hypothetical protein
VGVSVLGVAAVGFLAWAVVERREKEANRKSSNGQEYQRVGRFQSNLAF